MILYILSIGSFGFLAAVFATQNTGTTNLQFGPYFVSDIPVYAVVLLSFLIGLTVAWIIHLFYVFSTNLIIQKKEKEIHELRLQQAETLKLAHTLELENNRILRGTKKITKEDDLSL